MLGARDHARHREAHGQRDSEEQDRRARRPTQSGNGRPGAGPHRQVRRAGLQRHPRTTSSAATTRTRRTRRASQLANKVGYAPSGLATFAHQAGRAQQGACRSRTACSRRTRRLQGSHRQDRQGDQAREADGDGARCRRATPRPSRSTPSRCARSRRSPRARAAWPAADRRRSRPTTRRRPKDKKEEPKKGGCSAAGSAARARQRRRSSRRPWRRPALEESTPIATRSAARTRTSACTVTPAEDIAEFQKGIA